MSNSSVRQSVRLLVQAGRLPSEAGADPENIRKFEVLLHSIERPLSDDEACLLVGVFGSDGCFGLASSLLHLIETAPGWPIESCLKDEASDWVSELRARSVRGGRLKK